jgi:hypothetical protein
MLQKCVSGEGETHGKRSGDDVLGLLDVAAAEALVVCPGAMSFEL